VRLQAGRAEFQEEIAALNGEIEVDDDDDEGGGYLDKKSAKRRSEKRAKVETPMPASKERKRRREEEEGVVAMEAVMAKLKGRAALQPIDNTSKWRIVRSGGRVLTPRQFTTNTTTSFRTGRNISPPPRGRCPPALCSPRTRKRTHSRKAGDNDGRVRASTTPSRS
jgi:hypothetical protein